MPSDRVVQFRRHVLECEQRAHRAKTPEMHRAWLIAAREWHKMAEREAAKSETDVADTDEDRASVDLLRSVDF
jgi:hypothetical protein